MSYVKPNQPNKTRHANVLPDIKSCQSLVNGVRQGEAAGQHPDDDDADPSFHHGHARLQRVHDNLQRTTRPAVHNALGVTRQLAGAGCLLSHPHYG